VSGSTERPRAGGTLPSGAQKTAHVRAMFDTIAPRYDVVNRVITLGLDQSWRRKTVRSLGLPAGSVVLDLACGTGALTRLARAAGYRVVGADLSWGMLAANHAGQPAVESDASALGLAGGSMDGIVCGYALRNFTDLAATFAEMARVLRPGGRLAVLEVDRPQQPVLRFGHRIWFERVVPVLGGALSDADAYRYLPASAAYLPALGRLRAMLREAGFSTVGHHALGGGASQLLTATRVGIPPAQRP
jgi:demethylmenaquinone methyltransferase / 2-methoxy-6-polyprenyl-1,4-benzoquinol methylase